VACGSSSGTTAASSIRGAPSTSGTYDPTAWLGTYSSSGCSSASCCCAGVVMIAAANDGTSHYRITGSDLTSFCGGADSITASASPPASTYKYLLAGQSHTATLSGSTIWDYNTPSPSCSATVTNRSSSTTHPVWRTRLAHSICSLSPYWQLSQSWNIRVIRPTSISCHATESQASLAELALFSSV
jgi:hypothetical protein